MLELLREDLNKRRNGTPIYIYEMVFFVRRLGDEESIRFQKKLEREMFSPFAKRTDEDQHVFWAQYLAEYAVINWENVQDSSGAVEYSKENALKIFINSEFRMSLNAILLKESASFENYLYDAIGEEIEELKKP